MCWWLVAALAAPEAGLELERTRWSWAGGSLERVDHRLHGLPVYGSMERQLTPRGRAAAHVGTAPVVVPLTTPTVSWEEAVAGVEASLPLVGTGSLWPATAELVWRMAEGQPTLAWMVDASTAHPPRTWRVWVDAHTGSTLHGTITSRTALGRVYEVSPALGEPIEVDLPRLVDEDRLAGEYAIARSCDDWTISEEIFGETACHATSAHARPDGSGDYLFEPDPGSIDDPFAEVHAYFHVDRIAAWMEDRFDFFLGFPIHATVNFPMANAFYGDFDGDGQRDLSFGHVEDNGVDFGYDADVVYHEYGHAIVGRLASDLAYVQADELGMDWTAGAINEGAADLWSVLLTGDGQTGEYAGSGFDRPAIRDLEEDRRCPQDIQGEVHADGIILGSFGWNLYDDPAVGPEVLEQLLFGAIGRWSGTMDWTAVGVSLRDTADELVDAGLLDEAGRAAVQAHLDASGMIGCERIIPTKPGDVVTQYLINGGLYEDLAHIPASAQLSVEVPADAEELWVEITTSRGSSRVGWVLHGRVGEPIGHSDVDLGALGLGFAFPDAFDWRVEGQSGERVRLTPGGEVDLPAGETLYLSLASRNLGGIELLDFETAVVDVQLGWTLPEEEPVGGCACDGGRSVSWLWFVLPLLARRRR